MWHGNLHTGTKIVYPPTDGHLFNYRLTQQRAAEIRTQPVDHKSDALTTTVYCTVHYQNHVADIDS